MKAPTNLLLACIILTGFTLLSCEDDKKDVLSNIDKALIAEDNKKLATVSEQKEPEDLYFYMDKGQCLHTQIDCHGMRFYSDANLVYGDEEVAFAALGFKYSYHRILRSKIQPEDLFFCCGYCFDDSTYAIYNCRANLKHSLEQNKSSESILP